MDQLIHNIRTMDPGELILVTFVVIILGSYVLRYAYDILKGRE